jgi:hypothetical protein
MKTVLLGSCVARAILLVSCKKDKKLSHEKPYFRTNFFLHKETTLLAFPHMEFFCFDFFLKFQNMINMYFKQRERMHIGAKTPLPTCVANDVTYKHAKFY